MMFPVYIIIIAVIYYRPKISKKKYRILNYIYLELSTERTSSISSGSTEELNMVSKSTSLNTTKLEEELNPFEQSFETSHSERKGPQLSTMQHLNSVPSALNGSNR
jgi:hypothetical protein